MLALRKSQVHFKNLCSEVVEDIIAGGSGESLPVIVSIAFVGNVWYLGVYFLASDPFHSFALSLFKLFIFSLC